MPPWLQILIVAFLPGLFWAFTDILNRYVSGKITPLWGTAALSLGMLLTTLVLLVLSRTPISGTSDTSWKFLMITIAAGVINAMGYFFFFRFLESGGNFTQGLPIVLTFVVVITALVGIVIFKDPLTPQIMMGFIFAAVAITLLS